MHGTKRATQAYGALGRVPAWLVLLSIAWCTAAYGQGRPDIVWMGGGHGAGVASIAMSADGGRIATASFDTTVKVFNASSGLLERTFLGHNVAAQAVAFLPNGVHAVSGGGEGTAKIWNVQTGQVLHTLAGHDGPVNTVAVSSDGSLIATGGADGTIKIWSANNGNLIRTLSGHTGWVYGLTFSPDGSILASGASDGVIALWNPANGSLLGVLLGHTGAVLSLDISPDGTKLASGGTDDSVRIWNLSDGSLVSTFTDQTLYVYAVAFSPDGTKLASAAGEGTVLIRNVADGSVLQTMLTYAGALSLAFAPSGTVLYVGLDNGGVTIWNPEDGSLTGWLTRHWGSVNGVSIAQNGSVAVSAGEDGTAVVHDVATGATLRRIAAHTETIEDVAISPDGMLICTASDDYTAAIWNAADGTKLHNLTGHTDTVLCVAFAPDGTLVATGGTDATIRIWNVNTGTQVGVLTGHVGSVRDVAFSPDGAYIASGSADGTVRLWRVADGTQLWQASAGATVMAVAFSPDGTSVLLGTVTFGGSTLQLRSAANGTLIVAAAQSTETVRSVAFSPDGLLVVTGGEYENEGRLQFWQANNLALLQTFDEETGTCLGSLGVMSVGVTPDNQGVIYGRFDGTVVRTDNPYWPLPTETSVAETTAQIAEMTTLRASLSVALSGGPIMGKSLSFSVAGTQVGSGVTDALGQATFEYRIPEELGVGDEVIGAAFAGDEAYEASEGSAPLHITRANTAIIVTDIAGILGDDINLRAQLIRTTDDGRLSGRVLSFTVESTFVGTAVTDIEGKAELDYTIPIGTGAGSRMITVTFEGDVNHKECTAYGSLSALKRPTEMTVLDRSARIGEVVQLFAQVTFRGGGVEGLTVLFRLEGTEVSSSVTDASGTATGGYYVPEALGVGTHVIEAVFEGTSVYEASSAQATLTVVRTPTMVFVPELSRTVGFEGTTILRGYLYRTTDRAGLAGRPVRFIIGGVVVDSAITDDTGRATGYYQVPSSATSGDIIVRCVFDGDNTYSGSEGSGLLRLTIQKVGTYLWVLPRLGVRGSSTYLRGYLRRVTDYAWLPGKTLAAYVDGTFVGSDVTNDSGRASVFYRIPSSLSPGYHVITMTFDGDSQYFGTSGNADLLVL